MSTVVSNNDNETAITHERYRLMIQTILRSIFLNKPEMWFQPKVVTQLMAQLTI